MSQNKKKILVVNQLGSDVIHFMAFILNIQSNLWVVNINMVNCLGYG